MSTARVMAVLAGGAALTFVVMCGFYFYFRGDRSLTVDGGQSSVPPATPATRALGVSPEIGGLARSFDRELTAVAGAMAVRSAPQAAMAGRARVPTAWPGVYPRTSFPLFEHAILHMGDLDTINLVRHEELNPHDSAVDQEGVQDLRRLVDFWNEALRPVATLYGDLRHAEMEASIHRGEVQAMPMPLVPKSTYRALAQIEMSKGEHPGMALEEVVALLQARGGVVPLGTSGTYLEGRFYRATDFVTLPKTDDAFLGMKFVATEALASLSGWFVTMGLLDAREVQAILSEGDSLTRLGLAGRGPGAGR